MPMELCLGVPAPARWAGASEKLLWCLRCPQYVLSSRKLSEGASEVDRLEAYPQLAREDIHAAMRYAADTLAHEEVLFIEKDPAHSRD